MPRTFFTAAWTHLLIVTYPVPEPLLTPFLPPGCELDRYGGEPCVSLVAFHFTGLKVLGVPAFGCRGFPEVNLRFYVRHRGEPGIVFIREIVPNRFVSLMAGLTFNERFLTAPVSLQMDHAAGPLTVTYRLGENHLAATVAGGMPSLPTDPLARFVLDREVGFNITRSGQLMRFTVDHPPWRTFPLAEQAVRWDFARYYGPPFGFLSAARPASVMLVDGSEVKLSTWQKLACRGSAATLGVLCPDLRLAPPCPPLPLPHRLPRRPPSPRSSASSWNGPSFPMRTSSSCSTR